MVASRAALTTSCLTARASPPLYGLGAAHDVALVDQGGVLSAAADDRVGVQGPVFGAGGALEVVEVGLQAVVAPASRQPAVAAAVEVDQHVVAAAAVHPCRVGVDAQVVVAGSPEDPSCATAVLAVAVRDPVVAGTTTGDHVVAELAVDGVVATAALEAVLAHAADDDVRTRPTAQPITGRET